MSGFVDVNTLLPPPSGFALGVDGFVGFRVMIGGTPEFFWTVAPENFMLMIRATNLPTSPSGLVSGQFWRNGDFLCIASGSP